MAPSTASGVVRPPTPDLQYFSNFAPNFTRGSKIHLDPPPAIVRNPSCHVPENAQVLGEPDRADFIDKQCPLFGNQQKKQAGA